MGKKDKRVDVYIAKSAGFARPILAHLRQLVHSTCPDVEETIKWGFPHFMYKGMLCSMASFKRHCAFTLWKASVMADSKMPLSKVGKTSMGQFGQLTSLSDLPSDNIIIAYVKEGMRLNDEGVRAPVKSRDLGKKSLKVPEDFRKALAANKKALQTFEGFSYTNKKEYVEWVAGAKTGETRAKRLATSIEWLSKGKVRNWKYLRKS